ncbi:amidohydrolase family protein [candidate division KSB1 bacterium]
MPDKMHIFLILCFALSSVIFTNCSKKYDIIISHGTVYDGSGSEGYISDVGIIGNKIVGIGDLGNNAPVFIDATGKIISPGFIDIHTHCDRSLLDEDRRSALNYLMQGVTTVVAGNCGGGAYEVEKYYSSLTENGCGPNVVHLVGHGTVRRAVMQNADRDPTPEELEEMKRLVAKAMQEGAAGMSTGLFYVPGSYSKIEEVIELAKVVNEYNGIYATHLRDESNYSTGLVESIKEAIEIGERSGAPVQISHIKALGKPVWGKSQEVTDIIEAAQARGVKVYADQYPYIASSTNLASATMPRWAQADGKLKENLEDSSLRIRLRREIADNIERRGGPETLVISSFRQNKEWEGKSLEEISVIMGKDPVDTAIELTLMGAPGVVSFNMQEADLYHFMKKPYVMTGSDGSLPNFGEGVPHPRSYGTFPRKIREFVFNKKIITMAHAIRAATSLPAEMLGMTDRGMIKEGFIGDIVVFDPDRITDKATFNDPHQYSEGIEYLLVNGKLTIENGEYNGTLAGIPIKK